MKFSFLSSNTQPITIMKKNKTVGFTCSAFDLLHAGHIVMLKEASELCDHLIVGLQNDPSLDRSEKNKPSQSLVERFIQLSAVKYVDEIYVYNSEQDLLDLLHILPINIRILGSEYENKNFTGRQYCLDKNIELYFNNRDHRFSSSELRTRIAKNET
jgi:glycerol-3-phosphate cytidylyltransferase